MSVTKGVDATLLIFGNWITRLSASGLIVQTYMVYFNPSKTTLQIEICQT